MGKRTLAGVATLVVLALSAAMPASAGPVTINFTADAAGGKPNGFSPVGHPGVKFSDSVGADLAVGDYGVQSDGNALAVFSDDPSKLVIAFDFLVDYLRVEFGNDDPCCAGQGDIALLELFNGANLIGAANALLNLNDALDQFVEFAGGPFDRAEFSYADAQGNPINLIEVVDNITYNAIAVVPEPLALALLALGLASLPRRRSDVHA